MGNVLKFGAFYLTLCMILVACKKEKDEPTETGNIIITEPLEQKANYPAAAVANAIAFSINDKIYVGMGHNATGGKNDLWEYDPTTDKWKEKKNLPQDNTSDYTEYFVLNDKAYVIVDHKLWEYDPANDDWMQKADPPMTTIPNPFSYSFATDSKGYVGGETELYEYSPDTDTWKQCAEFTGLNRRGVTAVSDGQKGYIIGGNGIGYPSYESQLISDNFWTYSPANDKWSQKADFPSGIGLVYGLSFCKENSIYAGLGIESYLYTGSSSSSDIYTYIDAIYKYDAENNSWAQTMIPPLISKRCEAIGVVCKGKLYIGLGAHVYPHPFSPTEYYLDFWVCNF